MRKVFNKIFAGVTTLAMVATLMTGISLTTNVKADDAVSVTKWEFSQGGAYAGESGNEGYLNSVLMNGTSDTLSGWQRGAKTEQVQSYTKSTTGFAMNIANTGWDAMWDYSPYRINPWAIQGKAITPMQPGHDYTIKFKASAEPNKLCLVSFKTTVEDQEMAPYDQAGMTEGSDNPIFRITTVPKEYTFKITNWVSGSELKTTFMLGAFDALQDYEGNDISSIVGKVETGYAGVVTITDFSVVDNGRNGSFEDLTTTPARQDPTTTKGSVVTTTKNPATQQTTTKKPAVKKLTRVTKLKAKNNKKRSLKITWAKVKNAKKYQVKVGSKTYNTTKTTLTVKKLTKKKKYTIKVRAKASGYTTSPWSKAVKVKIKK